MRTLTALAFIAAAAALAVQLMRTPTVADGRVIEADLLEQLKALGVATMACDRQIPIGVDGATFQCVATLTSGATQTAAFVMHRGGNYTWKLVGETPAAPRIRTSGDPWAN